MKTLAGVLCCVCFIAVTVAYMADDQVSHTVVQRQDHSGLTVYRESAGQNKAIRIEVAVTDNCHWCDLFKQTTLPSLQKAGYKVTLTDGAKRGVSAFPTIHYIGMLGNVTHVDVGYRTYNQVTRYLEKP